MKDVPGLSPIGYNMPCGVKLSQCRKRIADAARLMKLLKTWVCYSSSGFSALIENADMVGLDLTLSIHDYIFKYLEDSKTPSPLLKEKVQKGELRF